MTTLLILLIIPLLWPAVAKWHYGREITWVEMVINMLIAGVLVIGGWELSKWAEMADTEILNGEVISKRSEHVSCSHSYSCNCRETCSGSGKERSCSTTCDTCHEHLYDIDWIVQGNIGEVTIDRSDRQGLWEPTPWTNARIGEPMALAHTYLNYVKGAKASLFHQKVPRHLYFIKRHRRICLLLLRIRRTLSAIIRLNVL